MIATGETATYANIFLRKSIIAKIDMEVSDSFG
ncbi:MAG: hypothetical protein E7255_13000 [Lachnospiraceae bacterium]|nr:hypothetical protein [Lachnospiraceae bacterium]